MENNKTNRQKEIVISVNDVYRYFKKPISTVKALRGVSLEIKRGDFVVIFGPSGCGKSTLLNLIAGIDRPTKGVVDINNKPFSTLGADKRATIRAREYGIVYQMSWWVKSLNVLENVALPLYIEGESEASAKDKAMEQLNQFKLLSLAEHLPTELSGGQQQLAGLARALVTDPPIIVADEPTGNLDSGSSDMIMGYLDWMNRQMGKTIILVTHNSSYWDMGNKRAEMLDGKIVKVTRHEQ